MLLIRKVKFIYQRQELVFCLFSGFSFLTFLFIRGHTAFLFYANVDRGARFQSSL